MKLIQQVVTICVQLLFCERIGKAESIFAIFTSIISPPPPPPVPVIYAPLGASLIFFGSRS